ncbi:MAG: fibrobacter succinogenes major paralogous domain-containing protein [Flavobacterium sp.]|uniref:fibrobacter succinogenes major paralogous domain-containing protein n=1 Tax=Flavobacterium sp. TaxID=239 RepID=UPI003BE70157
MKKLFTLLALVVITTINAQAPQGFNYQATVRNSAGALIVNQIVLVKFNIYQNSVTGTLVYSENQTANTDDLGHIALVVGQGTATTGTFSNINWGNGSYYLGIELNTGSGGYVDMGITQLLSVPYALYSNSSATSTPQNLTSVLNAGNSADNTKIINLGDPVDLKDAVNKDYVDAQILILQNYINTLPVTDIDGNTYLPLSICGKTWTKSDLNVSKYTDGTPIPQVTDPTQWSNLTTGAWCYNNNDASNGPIYGKMYNWYAIAGIYDAASLSDPTLRKKIAPTGWHVPTFGEWLSLINCLGGLYIGGNTYSIAGGKMKEVGTTHWNSPNTGANNSSGFTALPSGDRNYFGNFDGGIGTYGGWWSSSSTGGFGYHTGINYDSDNIILSGIGKGSGSSVRCIKD